MGWRERTFLPLRHLPVILSLLMQHLILSVFLFTLIAGLISLFQRHHNFSEDEKYCHTVFSDSVFRPVGTNNRASLHRLFHHYGRKTRSQRFFALF